MHFPPQYKAPSAPPAPHAGRAPFRPLIFGEALFDHFPHGEKVLGGAPFNVAWHLRGFQADPLLVTSVGEDPEGDAILHRMEDWGLGTEGVQRHGTRPTGRVFATFEAGEPRYEIEAGQAYDAVTVEGLPQEPLLARTDLFYHGSLALREATSAETLSVLRTRLRVPVLVDVNLRPPWWNRDSLLSHLKEAHWAKMNREEAGLLARESVQTDSALETAASALREALLLDTLVVTLGPRGAMAAGPQGIHWQEAPKLSELLDPVGAGDAFSAVLALAMRGGWPLPLALGRAADFAAEICGIRGAIPEDRHLYSRHLRRWNDAP